MNKFIAVLTGVFLLVSSAAALAAGNREDIDAIGSMISVVDF